MYEYILWKKWSQRGAGTSTIYVDRGRVFLMIRKRNNSVSDSSVKHNIQSDHNIFCVHEIQWI